MNYSIYVKDNQAWISSCVKKGNKNIYNNLVYNAKTRLYKDLENDIYVGVVKIDNKTGLLIRDYFYELETIRTDKMTIHTMTDRRIYVGFIEFGYLSAQTLYDDDFFEKVLQITTLEELKLLQNEVKQLLGK